MKFLGWRVWRDCLDMVWLRCDWIATPEYDGEPD